MVGREGGGVIGRLEGSVIGREGGAILYRDIKGGGVESGYLHSVFRRGGELDFSSKEKSAKLD